MTHFPNPRSGLVPIPVKSSEPTPNLPRRPEPRHPPLTATVLDRLLKLARPAPEITEADASLSGTWELRYLVDRDGVPQMLPDDITAERPVTITGHGRVSFDFGTTHAECAVRRRACGRLVCGPFKMIRDLAAGANATAFRIERTMAAAFTRAVDAAVVDGQMSLLTKNGEVLAVLTKW